MENVRRDALPPPAAQELHDRARFWLDRLTRYGRRRFGSNWLGLAAATWFGGKWEDRDVEEEQNLFHPWAFYEFEVEGRPVARWYLAEKGADLKPEERAGLEAELNAWISLWEVRATEPGVSVTLRDLHTGETRRVTDVSASRRLKRWEVVLGRVVDADGLSVLGGVHPYPLSPAQAERALRIARRQLGVRSRVVPVAPLRAAKIEIGLLWAWRLLVEEAMHPQLPELANTDGDPLMLTTDHFGLEADVRADVVERLCALEGADREDAEDGAVAVVLSRPSTGARAPGERLMVARIAVGPKWLKIETNSTKRADDARARVEEACGSRLRFRAREHSDPATLVRQGDEPRVTPEPAGIPPEERERILAEFQARYYAGWLDDHIPALGGKTPREVAASAAGRRKLEALLKEFEYRAESRPEAERFDFGRLREELGLER